MLIKGYKLFGSNLRTIYAQYQTHLTPSEWFYYLWVFVFIWQVSQRFKYIKKAYYSYFVLRLVLLKKSKIYKLKREENNKST